MMYFVCFALLSFYLALILGTREKFKQNNIILSNLKGVIILPGLILFLHLVHLIKNIFEGNWKLAKVISKRIINYPIYLGELIEIILEREAYRVSIQSEKIVSYKKRKKAKKQTKKLDIDSSFLYHLSKDSGEFLTTG
ncbi:hypothetical protein [Bacillus safensis]|uniref:hypothetical protein n=1 Tax=Bacillus safensis TaxID=561879 RepID=UPI00384D954A